MNFPSSLSLYTCLMHEIPQDLPLAIPGKTQDLPKFKNICFKYHRAKCFLAVPLKVTQYFVFSTWHSMTKQSIYLLYSSALLHRLQMMQCFLIFCCVFPLGACTDFFKELCSSNKWFIYYPWHLNLLKTVSRHHFKSAFRYYLRLKWWKCSPFGLCLQVNQFNLTSVFPSERGPTTTECW